MRDVLVLVDNYIQEYESERRNAIMIQSQIDSVAEQLRAYPNKIALLEEVRVFMQTLAEATRDEIMSGLQEIVTRCLQSVFGPSLSFEIEVVTKNNSTGIEFYVVDNSGEHEVRLTPEDSMGGGVIDTVSIGLRFGLLKILTPAPEGPIFLDEPAKMVSGDRIGSIAHLLKELAELFDKQVILVTHHDSLLDIVDNSVFVKNENGVSECI